MKQFLIFIGGMVAGALLLYFVLYSISVSTDYSEKEKLRQQLVKKLTNSLEDLNSEAEVQYIEIKGKNGIVTLHTGMSKDSVQILVGKPDEVNLRTYGSTALEDWGYKINNKYGLPKEYQIADLTIDFENGKLKSVRQN